MGKDIKDKIWLSSPHMGGGEQKFIDLAFNQNWVAPLGPNVDGFEDDLEEYLSIGHAVALSSGTAAIHLGLVLAGVAAGDEVLCQSFTFSATANPIVYQGATPIFVDSEAGTWNMSPAYLEKAIVGRITAGRKPKLIIPVHLYGMPAHMNAIQAISDKYGIPILEDAAEALGSSIEGKKAGTFGTLGVLSFNGNKIITTSGGGALVAAEEGLATKARFLATQARDEAPHYQHSQIGYNYRMSNICAGIGRGQMEVLDNWIERRRANYSFYRNALEAFPGIHFQEEPVGYFSNRWLTAIIVDPALAGCTREDLRTALQEQNIESRPLWKPMHLQPVFEQYPYYGDAVSEGLFKNGLCLPSGSNLTDNQRIKICEIIKDVLKRNH
jgi:dTDP-4-amino-4,6-dideoxygalactose transaminase